MHKYGTLESTGSFSVSVIFDYPLLVFLQNEQRRADNEEPKIIITMSRFAVLALFLFSKTLVSAQPGGGGGLCIGGFYDKQRQKIDIFTDKNIEIRSFGLQNGKLLYESKLFQYQPANYKGKPQTDFCLLKNIEDREPNDRQNDQRLYIKYKGETMVLDLLNIMGENGMGNHDEMDSVVVHSGYFCYDRDVKARYLRQERGGETRKNTKNGLTPNTQTFLIGKNILKVTPKCNTDFFTRKKSACIVFCA